MLAAITWPFSLLRYETISLLNEISCIALSAHIVNELKNIVDPGSMCLALSNNKPAIIKIDRAAGYPYSVK